MKKSLVISLLSGAFCLAAISPAFSQKQHKANLNWLKEEAAIGSSIVLLNNEAAIVPLKGLDHRTIAAVNLGVSETTVFDSLSAKYAKISAFDAAAYNSDQLSLADLSYDLKFYNTVLLSVSETALKDSKVIDFILDNQRSKQLILVVFGKAAALQALPAVTAPIVWAEKQGAGYASYAAQLIFGGVPAKGKLPQGVAARYKKGDGFQTAAVRLKYTVPEDAGILTDSLEKPIDKLMAEAIEGRGTPGAVIMVVKDGKVIFNKAYGHHTYTSQTPDRISDIFDMASVTKTSATTPSVMRLYEQNKLKLDTSISAYIPKAREAGKTSVLVKQVMLHEAGFIPYIPFYKNMKPGDMSRDSSAAYPVKAADNVYMRKGFFEDVMWKQMLFSPLKTPGQYVYSDLSMYFMQQIVEQLSGEHLQDYVQENFYRPLGMQTAGFLPRKRFDKSRIVPTELDTVFRKGLVEGYVHDPGAAMAGGVAGHAGLFASSNDIAILYQMLLNGGSYGGEQYFKPETVKMFTSKQSLVSRRGLGFDRKDPESKNGYPSKLASASTFGHTGYTGIGVWADPETKLLYIFFSNRVHPYDQNQLSTMNIRSRLQDAVYRAVQGAK